MTDPQPADEKLREAFQSLGDAAREEPPAEELDRVWRAVSGALPPHERRELVDRMASDPALAESWRAAEELWRTAPREIAAQRPGTRFWSRPLLAAAAVLFILVAAGLVLQFSPRPGDDTFRRPDHYVIESNVPADAVLARDAFRLRWTPGPEGSRYTVRVTTEDLRVLTTASDLTVPELVLSRDLLANLAPGSRVFWQVDVTLPGREGTISSQTFIVRVQ